MIFEGAYVLWNISRRIPADNVVRRTLPKKLSKREVRSKNQPVRPGSIIDNFLPSSTLSRTMHRGRGCVPRTVEREMVTRQEAACTRRRKAKRRSEESLLYTAGPRLSPSSTEPFGWWISKLIVIYQAKGLASFN